MPLSGSGHSSPGTQCPVDSFYFAQQPIPAEADLPREKYTSLRSSFITFLPPAFPWTVLLGGCSRQQRVCRKRRSLIAIRPWQQLLMDGVHPFLPSPPARQMESFIDFCCFPTRIPVVREMGG
ncbi:hypothetical protein CDAR_183941 [Caerostris darwini]|uniref:Uncharacterized protein n=1 Tax=Caerostris darwini TaxID=1538125 RepID=A0AAV4TZ81_9ARAC|nr:hypothetical protein CDAR_183941 [Caerostris darwini]